MVRTYTYFLMPPLDQVALLRSQMKPYGPELEFRTSLRNMRVSKLFEPNPHLRIQPGDRFQPENRSHGVPRPKGEGKLSRMRATLQICVGETPEKDPIWAEWPMLMHRSIPDGSLVECAFVRVESFGGAHEKWRICFTVHLPQEHA